MQHKGLVKLIRLLVITYLLRTNFLTTGLLLVYLQYQYSTLHCGQVYQSAIACPIYAWCSIEVFAVNSND